MKARKVEPIVGEYYQNVLGNVFFTVISIDTVTNQAYCKKLENGYMRSYVSKAASDFSQLYYSQYQNW